MWCRFHETLEQIELHISFKLGYFQLKKLESGFKTQQEELKQSFHLTEQTLLKQKTFLEQELTKVESLLIAYSKINLLNWSIEISYDALLSKKTQISFFYFWRKLQKNKAPMTEFQKKLQKIKEKLAKSNDSLSNFF